MNKYLIFFIIILLIFCFFYLTYRSLKDDELINNIDNNIEKYYNFKHDNIDSDDYILKKENSQVKKNKLWDGVWVDKNTKKIYANFLEINDKLIIYLSHYNINNEDVKNKLEKNKNQELDLCPPNTFLAIGSLNENKTFFTLSKILCNNFNLNILDFTGILDIYNKSIILNTKLNTKYEKIIFNKIEDFNDSNNSSNYLKLFSNIIPLPNVLDNSINIHNSICSNNNVPCIFKNSGLAEDTIFNIPGLEKNKIISLSADSNSDKYNACAINKNKDNICKSTPTCVFYSKPIKINNTTIPVCNNKSQYINHLNYMTTYPLIDRTIESLQICNYLKYFNDDYCNSSIICYISNLGNVKTLNYDYFNPLQNNLTLQNDIFYDYLNNSTNGLLYNYRKKILDDKDVELLNPLYFTNLIEKNNSNDINYKTYLKTLKEYVNNYENKKIKSTDYKKLFPAIWKINANKNNSCSFKLSTNPNYNSKIKYVDANEYNDRITLNLYEGGFNQNLYMENVNIIKNITPEQSTCMDSVDHSKMEPPINRDSSTNKNISCLLEGIVMVALTGNIKTNNNKYLVPNDSQFGFQNNSTAIKLSNSPPINGKWFIFGFNIRNKLDNSVINDLIKIDLNS
jgi:hypothetical protein